MGKLLLANVVVAGVLFGVRADGFYSVSFDESAKVTAEGLPPAKPGVVYGAAVWRDGVSGKALEVVRQAYDRVTAFNVRFPAADVSRGTLSWWMRPHWKDTDRKSHRLFSATAGQAIRLYAVQNGKSPFVDFSFCAPKQNQLLPPNVFPAADKWYHLAIGWDNAKGEVRMYRNGKLVGRKVRGDLADPKPVSASLDLWLGSASSDRFKAEVGEADYDELRFYPGRLLTDEDVASLALSDATPMRPVSVAVGGDGFFAVRYREQAKKRTGAGGLFALKDGSGRTWRVMTAGDSGKTTVCADSKDGKRVLLSGAASVELNVPHRFELRRVAEGTAYAVDGFADGILKGVFLGKVQTVERADVAGAELTAATDEPCLRAERTATADERPLWTLDDAERRTAGPRTSVTLNGLWRVRQAEAMTAEPPDGDWLYSRVPGGYRSPVYAFYRAVSNGVPLKRVSHVDGKLIREWQAGWYQRTFAVPPEMKEGGRLFLRFDDLHADYARVFLNGRQVGQVRQEPGWLCVPSPLAIDVTDAVRRDGENVLTLFEHRRYVGLWQGMLAIGDHSSISVGDVWLDRQPDTVRLADFAAVPSGKGRQVTMFADLENGRGTKGKVRVDFSFVDEDGRETRFFEETVLDGGSVQRLRFTADWRAPRLWNRETPHVYRMTASVWRDGDELDRTEAKNFGYKEICVDGGDLRLNGDVAHFRMWSSPCLSRLRNFHGDPDGAASHVRFIRTLNYDAVRMDPAMDATLGVTPYLDASDRAGLCNMMMMPPYVDQDRTAYAETVRRFFMFYASHPSVAMWYSDFNTCHYPWCQDPAKLADNDYDPPSLRFVRGRTRVAEAAMKAFDPDRIVFRHAGGCEGEIYTSMNYQSFGTPLREQEDWPAQWAASPTRKPLIPVESGFPYPYQLAHFDKPELGDLTAEHAARLFGDAVYADERRPVRRPWEGTRNPFEPLEANRERLWRLMYRRVAKAWRGYGISGIGDFPGGRDLAHVARSWWNHTAVWKRFEQGGWKRAGFHPDAAFDYTEANSHPIADATREAYFADVVRECFAPELVFLGGAPDDFTQRDHAFFSGEKFVKSAVCVNDTSKAKTWRLHWELRLDDEKGAVQRGDLVRRLAPGEVVRVPFELTAPDCFVRRTGRVVLQAVNERGQAFACDELAVQFHPRYAQAEVHLKKVALYDPKNASAALLEAAGVPFERVSSLAALAGHRLLVVGRNALGPEPDAFLSAVESAGLIERGLKVLVFEQQADAAMGNFEMASPSARNAFVRVADSPYLRGLSDEDLSDWRGAGESVPAFVVGAEQTPHYPRSKWKCGNGGMVAGNVIRKPAWGNFTAHVDCGFNLMHAALLEGRRGHGLVVFCQLDVSNRYGRDPAATLLVNNLFGTLADDRLPAGEMRATYLGNAAGESLLQSMGVDFSRKMPLPQVLFYGAGLSDAERKAVRRAAVESSWQAVVALPGADVRLLDGGFNVTTSCVFRGSFPKGDILFRGLSAGDYYFRQAEPFPAVTGGPSWTVRDDPGIVTRLTRDTGAAIALSLAPQDAKGLWNDEKVSRIWGAVLNALNVRTGRSLKLFSGKRGDGFSPYVTTLDAYDGDAFHNW